MVRLALIADVHANLEALLATYCGILEEHRKNQIDVIVNLGDTIGYYNSPRECLNLCRSSLSLQGYFGELLRKRTQDLFLLNYDDLIQRSKLGKETLQALHKLVLQRYQNLLPQPSSPAESRSFHKATALYHKLMRKSVCESSVMANESIPQVMIGGNHDYSLFYPAILDRFNPLARYIIEWTRTRLTPEEISYIKELPHTLPYEGTPKGAPYLISALCCYHAVMGKDLLHSVRTYLERTTFSSDASFHSVLTDIGKALFRRNFKIMGYGHTHKALAAKVESAFGSYTLELLPFHPGVRHEFCYKPDTNPAVFVFNVGAVGQPRDGLLYHQTLGKDLPAARWGLITHQGTAYTFEARGEHYDCAYLYQSLCNTFENTMVPNPKLNGGIEHIARSLITRIDCGR